MAQQFIMQGRLVWGHPGKSQQKKDQQTKVVKLHPQTGKPIEQWVFGIAIPKAEFNAQVLPYLHAEAASVFPNGVPPRFAWKYKDGDGVDDKGKPFASREGYAGCCVVTISTEAFAPPVYKYENGAYRQMEANEYKCGDFLAVSTMVKFNEAKGTNTPGLYVNPNGIVHVGYGAEIVSNGADPDELFQGFNHGMLPQGASATPVMGGAPMPAAMGMQQPPAGYGQPPVQQGYPQQQQYAPAPMGNAVPQAMNQPPQQATMQAHGQPASQHGQAAPMSAYPSNNLPPPATDFVQNAGMQQPAAAYGQPPVQQGYPQQQQYTAPPVQPQQQQYAPAPQAPMGNAPAGYAPAAGVPQQGMPQTYAPAATTYPTR